MHATEEQDVADPSEGQAGDGGQREEGKLREALRGKEPISKMRTWQEMGKWLQDYDLNSKSQLFPTEISWMWISIVQVSSASCCWNMLQSVCGIVLRTRAQVGTSSACWLRTVPTTSRATACHHCWLLC
jgi:hypothetical protein